MRNQTLDCQIPSSAALPLSYRDSIVSCAIMTFTCDTCPVKGIMCVKRIRKIVDLKLCKDIRKDVFPLVERQENCLGNFPIHRMNTSSHLLRSK